MNKVCISIYLGILQFLSAMIYNIQQIGLALFSGQFIFHNFDTSINDIVFEILIFEFSFQSMKYN